MYRIIGGDGQSYGPISAEQLRQWIAEGRANAQTRVQAEGQAGWVALGELAEFAGAVPSQPAPPLVAAAAPRVTEPVPNYLVHSILVTICCCIPLGIPAIVFAAQVNSRLAAGNLAGARESSRKARLWCWVAFGVGVVVGLVQLLYGIFFFMQSSRSF